MAFTNFKFQIMNLANLTMMTLVQGLRAAIVSLRDVTGLTSEPFEDGPFCGSMNENANVSFDWFDAGEHTEVASPEGMIMYMDGTL